MPETNARRISLVMVLVGPLLLFGPMLLRGEVLYWGTPMLQFVPWHRFALETLRLGEIPLWNPMLGMGAPLLANLQSAVLYPPNLLLWIVGPELGHGYLVVLHLLIAAVGMMLLARKLGLGALGQMVAAVTFSMSGFMVARAWFISINHAAAWLPWILLFAEKLFERMEERPAFKETLPAVLGLTLALTLQWLAGHAQTAWYSLAFLAAWTLWRLSRNVNIDSIRWVLSRLLYAGLLAFILSAAQLIPTLEYLSISQRAGSLEREFALTYSFWPWRFLGLFFPDLFGNPAHGDYWGYGNFWEDAIYIGVFPVLLALGSIRRSVGKSNRNASLERFLLITSGVVILLALGKNTPFFLFLFEYVPTFNLFQAPTRWTLILVFAMALLAAKGAEYWSTPRGKGLYWTRLLTAGAGIIAVASYLGLRLMPQIEPSFVRAFALGGIFLTLSGLLTLFLPKGRVDMKVGIVGSLLIVDLVLAGQGLNPSLASSVFEGDVLRERVINTDMRVYMPSMLEDRLKFEESHRFDTFEPGFEWGKVRDMALPNTSMLDGIASVNNFDPMLPDRYVTFMEALETLPTQEQDKLLTWMGVAYRVAPDPLDELGVIFLPQLTEGRVHFVAEATFVDSAEKALELVVSGKLDLDDQLVLEGEPTPHSWSGGEGTIVSFRELGPNAFEITIDTPDGGWLAIADSWYPGWEASLDGTRTQIFRANYLFRAVAIPPGTHTLESSYRPMSFSIGSMLSLIGLMVVTIQGIQCFRKK